MTRHLSKLWPMKRNSPDFMEGFQRGYAEALNDVAMAGGDAIDGPEALRVMASAIEEPVESAERWVREDDGSIE